MTASLPHTQAASSLGAPASAPSCTHTAPTLFSPAATPAEPANHSSATPSSPPSLRCPHQAAPRDSHLSDSKVFFLAPGAHAGAPGTCVWQCRASPWRACRGCRHMSLAVQGTTLVSHHTYQKCGVQEGVCALSGERRLPPKGCRPTSVRAHCPPWYTSTVGRLVSG